VSLSPGLAKRQARVEGELHRRELGEI